MSGYVEYLFWALFALLGFGGGWLVWGRTQHDLLRPTRKAVDAPAERSPTLYKSESGTVSAGPAPFRVVTLDGNVRYEGRSGADARRRIELLRSQGVEWRAYRDGVVWDWGPRDV